MVPMGFRTWGGFFVGWALGLGAACFPGLVMMILRVSGMYSKHLGFAGYVFGSLVIFILWIWTMDRAIAGIKRLKA